MYLHDAIQAAASQGRFITRSSWEGSKTRNGVVYAEIAILPTNTPDGCIVLSPYEKNKTTWMAREEDLLASDWEPAVLIVPEAR